MNTGDSDLRVLGVIPARLASTRLPRKVLREIAGRPMIVRVFEGARRSKLLDDLVVATDSEEVHDACARHDVPTIMTAATHASGTDRVWEVAQTRVADVYVNIQGDEPMISPGHIDALVRPFHERPDTQVATLKIRATDDEAASRTVNKVVCDLDGRALYFSKWAVPFDRDDRGAVRYKHVGLYAYRRDALLRFHGWPPSPLEILEGLEQLRFLEHGVPIVVNETDEPTIGVDTEADLRAVEERFSTGS